MISYCINLDRRQDKWHYVQNEFKRVGIHNVIRFSAVDTKPGWVGCRKSQLKIMELCRGENEFCIFEDDVKFIGYWGGLIMGCQQLPSDWDCLYLGASPREPQEQYSSSLFRLKNAVCAHAIIWHNRTNGAVEYILSHSHHIRKIDDFYATVIQPNFNCFIVWPIICTQTQFKSDTCTRSDVSTIEKQYNKFINVQ